jgi:hypothetical protein
LAARHGARRRVVAHRLLAARLADAREQRDQISRARVQYLEAADDLLPRLVANPVRLELQRDPPVDANAADVGGVSRARTERQAIQRLRYLLVRRELAPFRRRDRSYPGRRVCAAGNRGMRARREGERDSEKGSRCLVGDSSHEISSWEGISKTSCHAAR